MQSCDSLIIRFREVFLGAESAGKRYFEFTQKNDGYSLNRIYQGTFHFLKAYQGNDKWNNTEIIKGTNHILLGQTYCLTRHAEALIRNCNDYCLIFNEFEESIRIIPDFNNVMMRIDSAQIIFKEAEECLIETEKQFENEKDRAIDSSMIQGHIDKLQSSLEDLNKYHATFKSASRILGGTKKRKIKEKIYQIVLMLCSLLLGSFLHAVWKK